MLAHTDIYGVAIGGVLAAIALWGWLAGQLKARIRSRLRAVPLCLPLVLAAAGYGLFWLGFFSSPATAVQLHAVKLTLQHALDGFAGWIAAGWLVVSLVALLPLMRRV
jgi:hypothetical protein